MLHKKDYIAIASVLNKAHRTYPSYNLPCGYSWTHLVIKGFSDYFTCDNPNFDKDKFKTAILK
jgi:hypothetical protein